MLENGQASGVLAKHSAGLAPPRSRSPVWSGMASSRCLSTFLLLSRLTRGTFPARNSERFRTRPELFRLILSDGGKRRYYAGLSDSERNHPSTG